MPSIAERFNPRFKIASVSSTSEDCRLHLTGALETQDELDALVEALSVMRCWLRPNEPAPSAERDQLVAKIKRYSLPSQRAAKHRAERQLAIIDAASGMETRQGGDGTAPSQSDDSPAPQGGAQKTPPND